MELRKLEFLLDLAETENYSETAERMFTTQGNVSKKDCPMLERNR